MCVSVERVLFSSPNQVSSAADRGVIITLLQKSTQKVSVFCNYSGRVWKLQKIAHFLNSFHWCRTLEICDADFLAPKSHICLCYQ